MTRDPCKPVLSFLILCVLLELLSLQYTSGQSGAFGPRCLRCGDPPSDAQCTVDYVNQTISCTVNTSECDSVPCEEGLCHFMFINIGRWSFSSTCFSFREEEVDLVLEDECILRTTAFDRSSKTFPPPDGFFCQCNDYERCSFAEPLVYTHPSSPNKPDKPDKPDNSTSAVSPPPPPSSSSSSSPSPSSSSSYSPSSSPSPPNPDPAGDGSPQLNGFSLLATIVIVCLLVVAVTLMVVIIVVLCHRRKQQRKMYSYILKGAVPQTAVFHEAQRAEK